MKFLALFVAGAISHPFWDVDYMKSGAGSSRHHSTPGYMSPPWDRILGRYLNSGAEPSYYYGWDAYGRYLNSGAEPSYMNQYWDPVWGRYLNSGAEPSYYYGWDAYGRY